jgi:hypothetical protein
MENCVSNSPKDKIEFRFFGIGGAATGPHAINVLAFLCLAALSMLAIVCLQ